jgi:hypothetical protein
VVDSYKEIDSNRGMLIVAFVFQSLSALVVALVLRYLHRASAYRAPDDEPRIAWRLATIAPIVLAIAAILLAFMQLGIVDKVIDALPLSEQGVENIETDQRSTTTSLIVQGIATAAALSLAVAFILISRYARRAGLLSPFMGILGIIVGVILVLGPLLGQVLGALPVVQWFWLGSLAMIFVGRWPGGRGPAWESGEAEPWPSAAELRAQAQADAGDDELARPMRRREAAEPERGAEPQLDGAELDAEPAAPAHPRSKKRKRKRRR